MWKNNNDIIQGMYQQIHTLSTGFSGTFYFLYLLLQNKVITLKTEFNQICIFLVTVNLRVSLIIMIYAVDWTPHPCQWGVCKTRTGYLRIADADKKMRITKIVRGKNTRNADGKKNNNNINKQTIKERNLPFKSLSMAGPFTYIQNVMPIVDKVISYPVIPSINVTEIRTRSVPPP